MLTSQFGIEIEFTGITRQRAAEVAVAVLGGRADYVGGGYETYRVKASDGREWKFVYDGSIHGQFKQRGRKINASSDYSVELVSPILTYERDMDTLQNLVRALRKAGGFVNDSVGIHIHLDGARHSPKSIRNFINIVASKNDLFYKALQIKPDRMRYCKKMDESLVQKMNERRPRTMGQIRDIWYEASGGFDTRHYHSSRYHFLNLHSFFTGHHTVELRGFNSTLHAGLVRSYVVLALALNHQALTQKSASARKPQTENEKFSMRTYLLRIGFVGDAFKNCREHLCKHLSGNAAWRFGSAA
mgnify:CR=1 FL=1